MSENRTLDWTGRLTLLAALFAAFFVIGLILGEAAGAKIMQHIRLVVVLAVGYVWTLRGIWLSWKDILIIALLYVVIGSLMIFPLMAQRFQEITTGELIMLFLLGGALDFLYIAAGLWSARFLAIRLGRLRKPGENA